MHFRFYFPPTQTHPVHLIMCKSSHCDTDCGCDLVLLGILVEGLDGVRFLSACLSSLKEYNFVLGNVLGRKK